MKECYKEMTNNRREANSQHKGLEESVQINYRQFKSYQEDVQGEIEINKEFRVETKEYINEF